MSVLHLAVSMFLSSFVVIVIMLIRKIFKNQLSSKWQYNLWFILLIALTMPLLPTDLLDVGTKLTWNGNQSSILSSSNTSTANLVTDSGGNWMKDLSISVNRFDLTLLNQLFTIIWMTGMLVMIVLTIQAWMKLQRIKKSTSIIENPEIQRLFEQCQQRLHISQKLVLVNSPLIKSPITFGIFKTYIILPHDAEAWLSKEDFKNILLHELNHYKNKDIITNYLVVLFQILYWYNPLIWIGFREMRIDREIACDSAVLKMLGQDHYATYGNTIIKFADKSFLQGKFAIASQLTSPKKQLKRRIEGIATFTTESKLLKLKSIVIFILLAGIVVCQVPVVSAMPYGEDRINFDNKQTVYEDLSTFFSGYDGSFVLYDLQKAQYLIYNKDKSVLRVSPNSTYKVYSALFALESGVITPQHTSMEWDEKTYPHEAWNQNQNLFTAMENSVTWYYQKLDQKIGKERIKANFEKIHYGNQNVSGGIEDYWLESSLKISPIEQVQTLKDFYTNQFGFNEKNVELIKDAIKLEMKDNVTLYGKTGTGTVNDKNVNGWFIGYVETKSNTYFFATNIENDHHAQGSIAADITKSILEEKGIY
ncbi:BlaR1 family beta-lactam sensor/signal transducer [Gracilibacillus thailandensis]|uniref:BlaR1 family beta-lactam sensor/signal transducer n=1 Tax=Gracilibacillus thailandensis TaxID=563735 RepID=A0A6N7QY96_9BACI|nr:BlaR1 family beta-lactam sensor/signal transducer [Gracilibacillus thailandensis]MRI65861.1 BlaR1 family beta-lactam sensor/signal transducer [Gracilibacillus thailandensis]